MKNNYLISQPTLLRSLLLAIFALSGVSMSYAQIIVRDTFLANGSYTVPSGVTTITVQAWGGGGGGGRGFSRSNSAAGGGGGAFSQSALTVSPGDMFSVTVGTGGTGGTQDLAGTNGTATNFGGLVIAPGGFAPVDVIASQFGSNPGLGGPAGTGDITRTGGNGAAKPTNFVGGGGGSSGGDAGNGNNATGQTGGVAPGFGGNGGDGGSNLAPGLPGFVPGGGGGGKGGGQNVASGNGANGIVIVIYEIPEVELNCPDDVTLNACTSQSAVDAAFSAWLASFTFTGGCGTPEASFDDEYTAPSACGGSVTVTYRVASDCEPDKTCARTFAVTAAPTLSVSCPVAVTIPSCSTQATVDAAFADWIAGFTTTGGCNPVSTDLTGFEAPSFCGGVVNITFTANDDCAQSQTCTSTFIVTAAPTLSVSCPSAVTIPACSTQATVDAAFADWIAGFTTTGGCGTVSTDLSGFEAPSFCGGSVSITFTASDNCGQSQTCTSTFTVTAAPVLSVSCPSPVTIPSCSTQSSVNAAFAGWIAGFTTTGGCGTVSTNLSGFSAPSFCGGSVSITFTASDNCGQAQTCTSTFTVTAAPVLSVTCPSPVTIPACSTQAAVDAAFAAWIAGFSATGGCGTETTDLSGFEAPSFCGGVVNITFTAIDDCGQSETCTSTFMVMAAPTLSVTCPANVTMPACSTQEDVDMAFEEWLTGFSTSGGCNPVTTGLSGFIGGNPSVISLCGGSVTIVYAATDDCGQAVSCSSTFAVELRPTLTVTCPENETVAACSSQEDVDAAFSAWLEGFGYTGGCFTTATDLENFEAPSFCGGSVTIVYTAQDACNQTATCSAVFTVNAAPVLTVSCPGNETIAACTDPEAVEEAFETWIAGFDFDGGCNATGSDLSVFSAPSFCGGSVTVVYSATDDCDQTSSCVAVFTVTPAPVLTVVCPSNETIPSCSDQEAVDAAFAEWLESFDFDGGCNTIASDLSDFTAPSFCGGSVTVVYTATDDCDQTSSCVAVFTVTAAPVLTVVCPSNETIPSCSSQEDVDLAFNEWLESFDFDGGCNTVASDLSELTAPSFCGGSVTVVYSASDDCNQTSSCVSVFTVEMAPVLAVTCSENQEIPACATQETVDAAFAAWLEGFTVSGGCNPTTTGLEELTAPSACGGSVTVVFTATDDCDQTSSCAATFTVLPVTGLAFNEEVLPISGTENCAEVSEAAVLTASNNCGTVDVEFSETIVPGNCAGNYTIIRTWSANDCANSISVSQVVDVEDTNAPELVGTLPGGILENVLKSDAPSAPAESEIAGLYSDNCSGVNAELINSEIEGTECEWTAIYTYRITDDCGNEADEAIVVYQGIDTQAPVIESCADISVFAEVGECDAVVEVVTPEYSDNCEVTIEGVRSDQLDLDDLYPVGMTTITWTAVDEGGNTTVCVQTITVIEAQRIAVFGQGIEIENGSVTPIPLDGTKFGSVSWGGMITKTFTITNIGCIDLDLTGSPAVVLDGPGASFFSVVTQPAVTSLAPGSSTTFQVKYTGTAYGVHEATVIIANNDPMNDPFTFAISAATSQAIMRVTGNNITIPNGDVTPQLPDFTDFGVITFNGTRTRTFRVHNDGIANLLLTGNPRVQLFGANAAKFAVTTQPQATITPGANRLFQITFTGDEVGVFVATVSIDNTDLGASPYTFDIVATVLPPSMQVRGNNIIIANGDDTPQVADNTDFGFRLVGSTRNHTFTVNNVGAGHLFLSGSPRVQLSGPNANQFFVSAQPVALIAPASSSIFRITYAPTAMGDHTAVVTISNNDASNNPYVFTITGSAALPLKQGGIFEVPSIASDKKEAGDMRLYPNPAFDQVFVELPVNDLPYRVEFISIDGRVIHTLQTQGGRLEVNVADWKPGMYMMRATGIDVAPVRFIRAE
jgi:hypothetical protein